MPFLQNYGIAVKKKLKNFRKYLLCRFVVKIHNGLIFCSLIAEKTPLKNHFLRVD